MLNWISYSSLVPPNMFILLAMIGVLCAWWWRRAGLILATAAMACLYIASMPLASFWLVDAAERLADAMPRLPASAPPGAIIVLAAEFRASNVPGGKDLPGPLTLERLAEAAREQRRTGLPILTSGGWLPYSNDSLAGTMARSLEDDFRVPIKWREERSRTTYENAVFTAKLLKADNVTTIVLVTQAWHMRRALWSFERAGLHAIPYPAPLTYDETGRIDDYLPSISALEQSYRALHEAIGLAYYRLRY